MSLSQNSIKSVSWAVREIRESVDELLEKLEKKELYLPHLEKITSEHRKKEWLSVRILLKEILGEEKTISYTSSGKPYLSDNSYQISISHTKGYVAVILHPQLSVGIDIEYISPRVQKIRSRFMSDEEELHLDKTLEEVHLLLHWSAKESLFKILGEENVDFKTELHISPFKPVVNQLAEFSAYETKSKKRGQYDFQYLVTKEYVLTFTASSLPCRQYCLG